MKKQTETGIFVISLDFELFWGVQDNGGAEHYKNNILGARLAIPRILELFKKYRISATWAIVGFLFYENKAKLLENLPSIRPDYRDVKLDSYRHLESVGENELDDPFHFGVSLIDQIKASNNQEIASHTFSHYYCLEAGQNEQSFRSDLEAFSSTTKTKGVDCKTIVFSRNQVNDRYLEICTEFGIKTYRGNPKNWAYQISKNAGLTLFKRGVRLIDSYVNILGHNTFKLKNVKAKYPLDIRASRFLRPVHKKFNQLNTLCVNRILSDLKFAAEKNEVYHLWWHPHNFGHAVDESIANLEKILVQFSLLKDRFGMQSLTMRNVGELILND